MKYNRENALGKSYDQAEQSASEDIPIIQNH